MVLTQIEVMKGTKGGEIFALLGCYAALIAN